MATLTVTAKTTQKFVLTPLHHALFAAMAFVGVITLTAGGIAVFGSDRHAGPSKVVRIAAPRAEAARVSLKEAAVDPQTVAAEDAGFFGDEPPLPEDAAAGEVQVAVVESGPEDAKGARKGARRLPPPSPLPKAPIAGLHRPGPNGGQLPVVAPDGRTVARAYARPFAGDAAKPKIGLIVGGLGFNARVTQAAIDELPPEITLSFVPYTTDLQGWIDKARARGHEVLIELPMEPYEQDAADTGPQTLLSSASSTENIGRLESLLGKAAGYFGVTNYQGAKFAASGPSSAPVAQALKTRGLVMFGSGLGPRTALGVEAGRAGLPFTSADRIIDVRREADAIDEQLLNLEALALQNGQSLGSGFAFPVTIDQIGSWAENLSMRGYVLTPASAILERRVARR